MENSVVVSIEVASVIELSEASGRVAAGLFMFIFNTLVTEMVVTAMRMVTKLEDEKNGDSQHLPCFRFCSSFGDFSLCRIYKGGCVEMRVCIMGV